MKRLSAGLVVSVAYLAACDGCGGVDLISQKRAIAVGVCRGEPQTEDKGGTTDCSLGFDQSDLTVRTQRTIKLHSVGEEEVQIQGYELTGTSDPAFTVEYVPVVLKPGTTAEMVVTFRPLLETEVEGTIILHTDAQNAENPGKGDITINLRGAGVNNGLPELSVAVLQGEEEEACCDLGLVALGSTANCRLKLTNTGTRGLVLDELGFDSMFTTGGPWAPVGALPTPGNTSDEDRFTIAPASSAVISFKFTPTDEVESRARVFIRSNAPRACGPVGVLEGSTCNRQSYLNPCPTDQVGRVTVDLKGRGANPPTCRARIKSVNGSPDFDPRLIEPLDDVELTAEDSTASGGLTIASYRWEILGRPTGSTVRLSDPSSVSPRFVFDNSSTNVINGLDVVGDYAVRCQAVDSQGTASVNDGEAIVNITATPSEAILLQLVWDTPSTDVDLHLLREVNGGYQFTSENDCYYGNCKAAGGFGNRPVWDSANDPGQGGNPKLDVDDTQGFGPENSNIDEPLAGKYKAAVHYFSDHGEGGSAATLRVYVYGNLVAEYTKFLSSDDCWDVGNIVWTPGGAPDWEEVDAVNLVSCRGGF